uniref:TLC domain-containing protein n=1 Tax=Aureoumbra lagunensis TaxID=44058 RepID=A0A7S3K1K0_9STRA|mmetsp:Transcript_26335/g.33180  ORF Transcript_26335/g.33180 Transcript_26335/m.33180 type:complete len:294 (-) Transcript_26335:231-1112(-)
MVLGFSKKKMVEVPTSYIGRSYGEIYSDPIVIGVCGGMTIMYLILRKVFSERGSKFARNPSLAAHGFTFCAPFIYLSSMGIRYWFFDDSLMTMDRTFGYHQGAERIALVMVGAQIFDIPSSLLIGGALASPTFIAHHITVLWLATQAIHYQFVLYYGFYFLGVIELSTPLLAFVDMFRDFPKFADMFPITNEICRVLFAIAFFSVRIFLWIPASICFWKDALDVLFNFATNASKIPFSAEQPPTVPKYVIFFWLFVHAGLSSLQWYWATKILRAIYAMAIGDKSQRENEAKGA